MRTASKDEWFLARRPWTKAERRVVWRGFLGRLFIAIEPIMLSLVFTGLTVGIALKRSHQEALVLSPIFGCAMLAFAVYGIALMVGPVRALLHTFSPIYIVDGYLRYRKAHPFDGRALAYVAVLDEQRRILGEWPMNDERIMEGMHPAMIEFSRYGGVHRVDGKTTGIVPNELPVLGIGIKIPPTLY
jgi:hypothetical protein